MQQVVKLGFNCMDSEREDNSSKCRDERNFQVDVEQVAAVDQETFDFITAFSKEFLPVEYM